jgi:hypothetical protein
MKRQYEGNHQSNVSAQELASNHEGVVLHHQSGTRETFGRFPLSLWSQNRRLWGIGDMPRDHSALGGELSAIRKKEQEEEIDRQPKNLTSFYISAIIEI